MLYLFCFSSALLATSYLPVLPGYPLIISLFVSGTCLYCLWPQAWSRVPIYCLLLSLVGFSSGVGLGYRIIDRQLHPSLESSPLTIEGYIVGLPEVSGTYAKLRLRVDRIVGVAEPQQKAALNALIGQEIQLGRFIVEEGVSLEPGQYWRLRVKLRRPRGLVNPGGFDYQQYLLRQGLYAAGYVHASYSPELLGYSCDHVIIDCLRWRIAQQIILSASDEDRPSAAVLVALAVGGSQWLGAQQWDWLKQTGTIHLLAISGLHIGLAASLGFLLGRLWLKTMNLLFPYASIWLLSPALCSIALATIYSLLAGLSLPTQRALSMVLAYHIAALFAYKLNPFTLLAIALCAVAIMDPLAFHSQGFWLSFLAVLLLLYGFSGRAPIEKRWVWTWIFPMVKAQYILALGLLLPSLIWVQGVSLSAPLANLVAVSWVSFIVVPGVLLYLLLWGLGGLAYGLDGLILQALKWAVAWLLDFLAYIAALPIPFGNLGLAIDGGFSLLALLFTSISIALLLLPKKLVQVPIILLGLVFLLPLVFPKAPVSKLELSFMDVGQGTAIVLRTHKQYLVYDTGRYFSESFNIGEHVLAPYLRRLGADRIHKLMVSHADGDHAGGVNGLMRTMVVDELWLGEPLDRLMQKPRLVQFCDQGQQWRWGDVSFDVLWPVRAHPVPASSNNRSCVLLISYGSQRILLAGDIEKSVERQLLTHPLLADGVDLLLVGHHGSKTSSSYAWLRLLAPQWAVITAGYNNAYGHPHPSIEARLDELAITSFNTAELGAIRFRWADSQRPPTIERWRLDYPRYWYQILD